ncbi:MAG TPA: hypothetical protein VLT34_16480 [Arthrobacter sp.]|nr:hypothetical protein [Arthrobacter sp.]
MTDLWTATRLDELDLRNEELAAFVAAAPNMARVLKAILNLELGQEAERMVRTEIRHALG